MNQIQIKNVYKDFQDTHLSVKALGPLDLEIKKGEFVCILGESGCGKSTLLRLISGLEPSTGGTIKTSGKLVSGTSHERGMVFQSPALMPWLSVKDNITLGYKIRGETIPEDKIQEIINLVGLGRFENAKPKSLSGGMAQRVAIARSLVNTPDVLLMDEPFSALDALTRLRMQSELLKIWQATKTTIVFVTHDIDEAVALGTRIIAMTSRPGRILKNFEVKLDYPRSRQSPDFIELHSRITQELFEEINHE